MQSNLKKRDIIAKLMADFRAASFEDMHNIWLCFMKNLSEIMHHIDPLRIVFVEISVTLVELVMEEILNEETTKDNPKRKRFLNKKLDMPSVPCRDTFPKSNESFIRIFNPNEKVCLGWNGQCLKKPTYAVHPPEGDVKMVVYKCKDCANYCMEKYDWKCAMYLFPKEMSLINEETSSEKSDTTFTRKFNPHSILCKGWNGRCMKKPTRAIHPPEDRINMVVYKCENCAQYCMKKYDWKCAMYLFLGEALVPNKK
jgi:hypothetical protein